MLDKDRPPRLWKAAGRNGLWFVDEYREGNSGTWGTSLNVPTRKLAEQVATVLNGVYADGRVTGWTEHEDYVAKSTMDEQASVLADYAAEYHEELSTEDDDDDPPPFWRTGNYGSTSLAKE